MKDELKKYLIKFDKLNRGVTRYGKAPHKPVLLLSVLQAFNSKFITENRIYITPELVRLFNNNWTALVTTKHVCKFALPFYHLKGEKFWHLTAKQGFEKLLILIKEISSFGQLNTAIEYASLDETLFLLMKDKSNNQILQQFLLEKYFPETKNNITPSGGGQDNLFDDIQGKILNEDGEEYKAEMRKLINEEKEEEIYIRSNVFKKAIPLIYKNTCCISGMKIDATVNISMIDACHIVPFSESYNDPISNGIALCPNLHRAFDRGLISIDNDYKVIVSDNFHEDATNYSIRSFKGKRIILPSQQKHYPLPNNLQWHRTNIYR